MFKRFLICISALLILLSLCACGTEEPSEPNVPEESEVLKPQEEQENSEPEQTPEEPELNEKYHAEEIYYSEKHGEYISLINKRIESYKNGTFEEMPNHHPEYPEDFPPVENIPEASEKTVAFAWRNTKKIDENTYSDGCIDYVLFVDDTHAILLEPVELVMGDGTTVLTFANTGYISAVGAGYETIGEWFVEVYDGYYGEPMKIIEP